MDSVLAQVYLIIDKLLIQLGIATSGVPSGVQQGILIIIGIFFFTLLLGATRHHMLHWSLKGAGFGLVLGIIVTLVLEGVLLVGGKTAIAQAIKNNNTPPDVRIFLQKNLSELAQLIESSPTTLGASSDGALSGQIAEAYKDLNSKEQKQVRDAVCTP